MGILGVLATEKPKHHEENFGPAGKVCVALIVSNRSGLLDASRYGSFVPISPLVPLFRKGLIPTMGILPYPASSLWTAAPNAIEKFLGAHPAALKFVQTPKPIPTSFGKESLFAVSAFKFTNADGVSRYGRYRVLPVGGNEYLDEAKAAARSPNCLFDEIKERVAKEPVKFHIVVQLAEDGDTVDDATVR